MRALNQFDSVSDILPIYGTHSGPRRKKDISVLIAELLHRNIFSTIHGRKHPSFGSMPRRHFINLKNTILVDWMKSRLIQKM